MKFVYGDIPKGDKFYENSSIWRKADMDKIYNIYNKRLTFMGILSLLLSFGLGVVFFSYHEQVGLAVKQFIISFPIILILIFPIYYFFQIIFLPEGFKKSTVGLSFGNFNSFLFLDRSVSKGRTLFTLIIPFILFSILPFIAFLYFEGNVIIYSLLYCGILYSTFDILKMYAIGKYIPKNTLIRCYGEEIYYKYYGFTTPKNDKDERTRDVESADKVIKVNSSKLR